MNQAALNLGTLLNNPHFRYPLIAVLAVQIAEIWLPQFKDQLNATQKLIMFYVMAAAANTTSIQSKQTQLDNPPQKPPAGPAKP
jgi:hypothetical protein